MLVIGIAFTSAALPQGKARPQPVQHIYLNIRGDQNLAQRLWTYLQLELEDAGFTLANDEFEADAVVNANLRTRQLRPRFQYGIISVALASEGRRQTWDQCVIAHVGRVDPFAALVNEMAARTRRQEPLAKSLAVTISGNDSHIAAFRSSLIRSLHAKGFRVVSDGQADANLAAKLKTLNVSMPAQTLLFTYAVAYKHDYYLFDPEKKGNGSRVVAVGEIKSAPPSCAGQLRFVGMRVPDLDEQLFSIARIATRSLQEHNQTASGTTLGYK